MQKRRKRLEIKLLRVREAKGEKFTSPAQIVLLMKNEARADRECFWVLHLNNQNKIIEKELVSMGILASSLVHPREVFRKAVMNGTARIITIHNHPSGNLEPSEEDKKTWKQLKESGKILGIPVLDNIILAPDGRYFSEHGK